mmetsp:Transcript_18877/g.13697  ORF Transcript_18877/g.13697 Transcript_18877/m.13697 type:complete len:158 (+) Transcript_18877:601-1074(+)
MASDRQLYQLELPGYWMDIGQPKDYLIGQALYLQFLDEKLDDRLFKGPNIEGRVWVHPTAKVHETSILGGNVVVGENCVIGPGCKIYNSTILADTRIEGHSLIQGSIIGWKNKIGRWVRVAGLTVTGEDVELKDETFLNGIFVLPHKQITGVYPTSG